MTNGLGMYNNIYIYIHIYIYIYIYTDIVILLYDLMSIKLVVAQNPQPHH